MIIDKIIDGTITEEYMNYALNILNRCANRDSAPQMAEAGIDKIIQYPYGRILCAVIDKNKLNMRISLIQNRLRKS